MKPILAISIGIAAWIALAYAVEGYNISQSWAMLIGYWFYPSFRRILNTCH